MVKRSNMLAETALNPLIWEKVRSMTIHQRLRQLRLLRKLSQQQVADQLHMSRSAYTKLEANADGIRVELLHRIASILHVPVSLLLSTQPRAEGAAAWNDFDFMLEMNYHHFASNLAVVPYDELTLEQLVLLTSKGFGSRAAYEDTPMCGRLYSYGPRQIINLMFGSLSCPGIG